MPKNGGRTPHGRVHSVQIRSPRQGIGRRRGSPGVGNLHAGKYRERTLSRQRGGSGANASPLPTKQVWPRWEESLISERRAALESVSLSPGGRAGARASVLPSELFRLKMFAVLSGVALSLLCPVTGCHVSFRSLVYFDDLHKSILAFFNHLIAFPKVTWIVSSSP